MAEKQDDTLMDKIEKKTKLSLDDSMFQVKDEVSEEEVKSDNPKDIPKASDFEKEMDDLGLSKDGLLAIIDDVVTNGAYEEEISSLGGRVTFKLRSSSLKDSRDFVRAFDPNEVLTQLESEFQYNLGTMGLILIEHNGNPTGNTLEERMKYIEDNMPAPTFSVILKEVFIFGRKMNLIGADEVADFF